MDPFLPADAALFRCDPAFAGLGTLLNPDIFIARLSDALGRTDLGAGLVTYVKYVPRTKLLIGYHLAQEDTLLHIEAFPPESRRELDKLRNRTGIPRPVGPGRVVLYDCSAVVSFFPNDRRIPGLAGLTEAAARFRMLKRVLPTRTDSQTILLDALAYKPHRRYVACVRAEAQPQAVLKIYNPATYRLALTNARSFCSRGCLRLAAMLGEDEEQNALAFEWLDGRPFSDTLSDRRTTLDDLSRIGAALAELHAQCPALPLAPNSADAASPRQVAEALGLFYPAQAASIGDLARRLETALACYTARHSPLHGDFNTTQVLLTANEVSLLDLDRASSGDPAIDLGNFLAHLEREALSGLVLPTSTDELVDCLLHGYGDSATLRQRVRIQTALGLFRRLNPLRYWEPRRERTSPLRRWDAHWPDRVTLFCQRIEELLAASEPRPIGSGRPGGRGLGDGLT